MNKTFLRFVTKVIPAYFIYFFIIIDLENIFKFLGWKTMIF